MGTQIFGITEVLRIARDIAIGMNGAPARALEVQIIGVKKRHISIAGGISINVVRPVGRFDLLIVPGLEITRPVDWNARLDALSHELRYIQKSFAAGTIVASICVGAFLLGEAGILDGRAATTAWLFAPDFAKRYPATQLKADAVLLEDSGVVTTGAVSSAFDLAIHLIKQILGAEVAIATARVCLLPSQRESQSPFFDSKLMEKNLPTFSQNLAQWFDERLAENYDLTRLAIAFHVSASTLLRRVKAETGLSPLSLLQKARVEKAKQLLHGTNWGIARITEAVGYADVTSFSRLFARIAGESPARYRHR